jgi:hypothetical protein
MAVNNLQAWYELSIVQRIHPDMAEITKPSCSTTAKLMLLSLLNLRSLQSGNSQGLLIKSTVGPFPSGRIKIAVTLGTGVYGDQKFNCIRIDKLDSTWLIDICANGILIIEEHNL